MGEQRDGLSGRDYFKQIYDTDLSLEDEWLNIGAVAKVDSIEYLLRAAKVRPGGILELGCGTGSVIRECQRRGLAERYAGVDYSETAVNYLRTNAPGITAMTADIGTECPLLDEGFDVVVLSHVLEHLEAPEKVLSVLASARVPYCIFEVPLEDLPLGRLKARVKPRMPNLAGHVQFFDRASFERLVEAHGFEILYHRIYMPRMSADTVGFVSRKNRHGYLKTAQVMLTGHYLPGLVPSLCTRLYYAHYAAICRVRR